MKKYLEKKVRRYVIATMDIPARYMHKTPSKKEYMFVHDIEHATKMASMNIAIDMKNYYYYDTGSRTEMVILPLDISYELIDLNDMLYE